MKSKKVYIGILAIVFIVVVIIASIFYIKTNNKDVEISKFFKNFTNENTKEAMVETEEIYKAENTDKNVEENSIEATNLVNEEFVEIEEIPITNSIEEAKEKESVSVETTDKQQEQIKSEQEVVKKVEAPKKEIVVTPLEKTLYVNVESLNVRSGPDTNYSKLGFLKKAAEVKVTGKTNSWYRIKYNNKEGFVKASYLSESKPIIETPSVVVSNVPQSSQTTQSSDNTVLNNLIIINSRNNTLRYYCAGKLVGSYSCATGASATPTPTGKFLICNKIVNRPYYKLNIPGGAPNNPLGKRWLGLQVNGTNGTTYAIHGTNDESSIGKSVSHGCIRMHNAEVEALYEIVPIGTTVIIEKTSKTDKEIAASYSIYIE